ncbi:MAG TPA: ABC transporter substrate-binding protein [Acidothermaceae bacterium]|nr:ABC transporter substrate-binding protein [Acidothermaceae bacterium]
MARRILAACASALALAVAISGCSSSKNSGAKASGSASTSTAASGGGTVVIGSADFSESEVLANLYALLAQSAGYKTKIQTVTTREIYEPALEKGQIDIVPDYAATFTEFLNHKVNGANAATVATSNKDTTLVQLKKLAQPLGLTALEPSDAADQNAFAVTKDFAAKNNLKTLSDVAAAKLPIKLAAPAECKSRTFCGGALIDQYGINVTQFDTFDFDSVPGKKAVQDGKDDMVEVATDDGTLDQFNLVILDDDKHVQLADNLVPIVGKKYANDTKLADAINKLAPVLTSKDLGSLDAQVDNEKKLPADVAKAYLVDKGLIKG